MNQEGILAYIPQRPPFVMVDEVIKADDKVSLSRFTIRNDNIFIENGVFIEPGLVENMAQTAAAGTGYKLRALGKPVPVGYIAGIRSLVIKKLPAVNKTIITEMFFQQQIMNAHIVYGKIMADNEEIASCELRIFVKQED
ncbi:MAG TPA: hypothetical protein VN721_11605 [Flavipsychrobacter sp.]|nr:hypothetical protein [Flavipsychrobacter sp.]